MRTIYAADLGIAEIGSLGYDVQRRLFWIAPLESLAADGPPIAFENLISQIPGESPSIVQWSKLSIKTTGSEEFRLAPNNGRLFDQRGEGSAFSSIDLDEIGVNEPIGILTAPSGDLTDASDQMSLYVVGVDRIVEFSLNSVEAAAATQSATLIQTIDLSTMSPPSPDAAGIVYIPSADRLLVSDSEVNEMPIFTGDNFFSVTRNGNLDDTTTSIPWSKEPTGLGYDTLNNRLFVTDDDAKRLHVVRPGADGLFGTPDDDRFYFRTTEFGSNDPEDAAYDPVADRLYLIDGLNREVYTIDPGPNGLFDGTDDLVTSFDVAQYGVEDPEGLGFFPGNGHLYITGDPEDKIFEVSVWGDLIGVIDIETASGRSPADITFAPGSSAPGESHAYIVDRGIDNNNDPDENDGKIFEFSLALSPPDDTPTPTNTPEPNATPTSTPTKLPTATPTPTEMPSDQSMLIQTILTSNLSPSSPDPAGLVYLPSTDSFLISDSEVNEVALFTGVNLYGIDDTGSTLYTGTTIDYSNEPTGLGYDAVGNRLFISDDDRRRVHILEPGGDGQFGTGDDTRTTIDTRDLGVMDPEDVAYSSDLDLLFIADGASRSIYRIDPGPNGLFDAVDDIVTSFSVSTIGMTDPDGLGYYEATGHLYIVGEPDEMVAEVTIDGLLVRMINIEAANARSPSDIELARGSDDPSQIRMYITDQGIDNNQNPDENDGKIYEMTLPGSAPILTPTPTATPDPNVTPSPTPTPTVTPTATATGIPTSQATLVQTIHTSAFSPAGPDPSGIVYLAGSNSLLIADSEVNELSFFTGENLFQAALDGTLIRSATFFNFSDEPTGLALDTSSGRLFVSDDDERTIFEVYPGSNGLYGDGDDSVTFFETEPLGIDDPEDVAYDTAQNLLFVADGASKSVFRIDPGPDGQFGGADDLVSSFSVSALGMRDIDGLGVNDSSGTLFLVGEPDEEILEVTQSGAIVQRIDVSVADPKRPSDITLAPASTDPSQTHLYMTDQGIDNNEDPNENDGKIYEFTYNSPSTGSTESLVGTKESLVEPDYSQHIYLPAVVR